MDEQEINVFQNAKWIQGDLKCEAPLFRKRFSVSDVAKASIKICGLGFFNLFINGTPASDDLLVPGWSNYEKRNLQNLLYPIKGVFHHRIYFMEYDLTDKLLNGENVLSVALGNGWYNNYSYAVEGDLGYGFPKLCYRLTIEQKDGQTIDISSDETTLCNESEIISNNIHGGEIHDLRKRNDNWKLLGLDDTDWRASDIVNPPESELCLQDFPADKCIRTLSPSLILQEKGRKVYDCGENITGYPVLLIPASEGEKIVVRYSEEFTASTGTLDFTSIGGLDHMQEDQYLCGTQAFTCHPQFTWHGFRYFEIIGDSSVEVVEVDVVHANTPITSSFESSNETLNWIYEAYIRSQLGNLHCGVPSDCPHRERLGYTGDGQITCRAAMFCLDMREIYVKWMRDIVDGQNQNDGHVQHTAPLFGGGGGPGGWGGAIFIIPWQFYLHYGDSSLLEQYFSNILLWLDYMESCCQNGLVMHEEKGGWCLGDWCAPQISIPEPYVNTYYYVKGLETAILACKLLENDFDCELLRTHAKVAKEAMIAQYYDSSTGSFCGGDNGADAFAVDLNLGGSQTLNALVARYRKTKTLDTGIFGTDLLINCLFEHDYGDLAFELLTSESDVSFARMKREGATTLWEDWAGESSHNHPMFGGVVRSFFTHILGIRQKDSNCGIHDLEIRPTQIMNLDWVKGSVRFGNTIVTVSISRNSKGEQVIVSNVQELPLQ